MRVRAFLLLFLVAAANVHADGADYTALKSFELAGDDLVRVNLDDRHSFVIPDSYTYVVESQDNDAISGKTAIFQKLHAEEAETAHTIHYQVARLGDELKAVLKNSEDYLELVGEVVAARSESFKSKPLDAQEIAGRKFQGIQYLSVTGDLVEEGIVYASANDGEVVVLRAQEINEHRADLPALWAYVSSLTQGIDGADTDAIFFE